MRLGSQHFWNLAFVNSSGCIALITLKGLYGTQRDTYTQRKTEKNEVNRTMQTFPTMETVPIVGIVTAKLWQMIYH